MVLATTHCQLAGRYRLCPWLAAGGMGQVWQAVDEVLGRPVAVKLLRDEYAQDPSFVRRLRAEARYAAAVTHPGVASVFDYGEVTTAAGVERWRLGRPTGSGWCTGTSSRPTCLSAPTAW
jgi:serine/threonine protein kinase